MLIFRHILWKIVFNAATVVCSGGFGLHTFTAVPRTTQSSTLCGTVNEFWLSNSK